MKNAVLVLLSMLFSFAAVGCQTTSSESNIIAKLLIGSVAKEEAWFQYENTRLCLHNIAEIIEEQAKIVGKPYSQYIERVEDLCSTVSSMSTVSKKKIWYLDARKLREEHADFITSQFENTSLKNVVRLLESYWCHKGSLDAILVLSKIGQIQPDIESDLRKDIKDLCSAPMRTVSHQRKFIDRSDVLWRLKFGSFLRNVEKFIQRMH